MLKRALEGLSITVDPKILVGFETADDAGVYQLDENTAIVQTIDFFTPVVDDPYVYGQIAAANSLSDVYAMGGSPLFALTVVGFPSDILDESVLKETLRGGADKMKEASVPILGGHSVRDREMKFGYTVTGLVSPRKVFRNFGAKPGDTLILTKPLGTGIIATSIKFGKCPPATARQAIKWMTRLNRTAAETLKRYPVHAVTDITGYGLMGHAYEMAASSNACLRLDWSRIPLLEGVLAEAGKGMFAGGVEANRSLVKDSIDWDGLEPQQQKILLDPQTSGGLFISMPADAAPDFLKELRASGELGEQVGSVVSAVDGGFLEVVDSV